MQADQPSGGNSNPRPSGAGSSISGAPEFATTFASTYETSAGQRTGRYSEALALAQAMAAQWPEALRVIPYGTTPEGRTMIALAAGRGNLRAPQRPVLYFQAGIHPGEIEGKDAGFRVLRALLQEKLLPGALDALTVLFVPVLNCDGHERMGPNNRPNQRGPAAMGWRATAQNLNLNRDYTKVDTPEMAAILRLLQEWDPVLFCDIHATDGAQFEHDVSLLIDAAAVAPEPLLGQGQILQTKLLAALEGEGHLPVAFYPSLRQEDAPESGFDLWVLPPRYSNGYWGAMRQRLSILVETHSWRPYAHRVETVEHILSNLLEQALHAGKEWLNACREADRAAAKLAGCNVALTYKASVKARLIDFKGYAYRRVASPVSGRLAIQYDEKTKAVWQVPYHDELIPDCSVTAPTVGYAVPSAFAALVAARLDAHGIEYSTLRDEVPAAPATTWVFRAQTHSFAPAPFEGRTRLSLSGSWQPAAMTIPAGSLHIPMAQAKARLVLHLFEPQAPDSLAAWGLFNSCFERKEMMESYVTEAAAALMLADPKLRAEFAAKLESEAAFAGDSEARLDWFYQRHPAWDERYALYPVLRLEG